MTCEAWTDKAWTEKLDAHLDGELAAPEARELSEHLRGCAACAAESLSRVQQKRAVQIAGRRFTPDPAFRARVQKSIAPAHARRWGRLWLPALAGALAVLVIAAVFLDLNRDRRGEQPLLGEIADLHVATLASANPVDVVSTDRHTVKPWFAGKIPFTFNLPELQDSPFTLIGGKVSYLNQAPGAELIFRVRQHQISVFIFQERAVGETAGRNNAHGSESFTVRSWSHNGLRYFVIGDTGAPDIDRLSEMIKNAG
jgi:anti-sigma factor RsiW